MDFLEIKENDRQIYEEFKGSSFFLQDWEWGEFQKSLGREVKRFVLIGENKRVVVRGQGIVNKVGKHSYFFMPYGPVIAFERPESVEDTINAFFSELNKKITDLMFIRFEFILPFDIKKVRSVKSKELDPRKTLYLDLEKSTDSLLKEMHPKTRYNIRLAEKKGVEVRVTDALEDEGSLFLATAKRAGIRAFDASYYRNLLTYFKNNPGKIQVKLYSAWHEGDLLAANIMLFYKHEVNHWAKAVYLFGGSSDKKRNLMAPYLLQWRAILDAVSEGLPVYDFWGVEEDPKHPWYGFSRFKLGFGGQVVIRQHGTCDYVLKPAWYNLYRLIRAVHRKLNRIVRK